MSTVKPAPQPYGYGFWGAFKETLQLNANLLTIGAVVAIVFTGITIVDNPQNWWIALLAVVGIFGVVFLLMNAKAVIKAIAVIITTFLLSAAAFTVGGLLDPIGSGAFAWLFVPMFVLFASLSLSYFRPSATSRWTVLLVVEPASFILGYMGAMGFNSPLVGAGTTLVTGLGLFVLLYFFSFRRAQFKKMPQQIEDTELLSIILEGAEEQGLHARNVRNKRGAGVLLWNDNLSLYLLPVKLEAAFATSGERTHSFRGKPLKAKGAKARLSYKGKSVNSWLLYLAQNLTPLWRSRGAHILPVLLDVDNANGPKGRVIGVASPDTKRRIPVGVFPKGGMIVTKTRKFDPKGLLELMGDYGAPPTEKQKHAFEGMGTAVTTT